MDPELKSKLQVFLVIALVLAAARTGYIFYERRQAAQDDTRREAANVVHHTLTADDNVYERPFYGYDLASTKRELVGKTVWMKAGNYFHAYAYDASARRVNRSHDAGLIAPLEAMQITDVVLQPAKEGQEMLAIFQRTGDGRHYAVPIGAERKGQYRIDVENELYRQDPRKLYAHWGADVWSAIDKHEPRKGMNEQQMWLTLGYGVPISYGDYGQRRMRYENAGKPKEVRFEANQAVEIADGK